MNLATPILICHESEDFRSLLREMLTKNGFFHVLETSTADELCDLMGQEKKSHLLILQASLLNERLLESLMQEKKFIVLAQPDDPSAMQLAAKFGVSRLLSFPFSSQRLLEKISSLAA